MLKASTFGQDGVNRSDLPFHLETTKKLNEICATVVCKQWKPGSTGQWALREGGKIGEPDNFL